MIIDQVGSEIKLPVLYLIDSIVKNVNRDYLSLFSKNIVNTFCDVFEKVKLSLKKTGSNNYFNLFLIGDNFFLIFQVDENTRLSMWKLRQTWNTVFPEKKLYALDIRVKSIDPAWPLNTVPTSNVSSNSIYVNPRFLTMVGRYFIM